MNTVTAHAATVVKLRGALHLMSLSRDQAQKLQGVAIRNTWQHHRRGKERQKAGRDVTPSVTSLAEILEARQRGDTEASTFRNDGGEIGQRCHVGDFVERQEEPRVRAVVRAVKHAVNHPDNEGSRDGLISAGCHDV